MASTSPYRLTALDRSILMVAFLSVLLRLALPAEIIELWYSRGVFIGVRTTIDTVFSWIPVPLFYVFWVILLLVVFRFAWHLRPRPWRHRWRMIVKGVVVVSAWLIVLFLWLWGYNYGRVPVEQTLRFATYEPNVDELRGRVYSMEAQLSEWRAKVKQDTSAITHLEFSINWNIKIQQLLETALQNHDYPAPGRPRAWQLLPRGVLLRLSTAGVYWPWAAQGNIDAGLHPLQKPAVMAHELAHAYGFGEEGTCSFWAYLAGQETSDPLLRYCLELAYWRHLAGRLRYAEPERYLEWRATELDPGIRNDLEAIYANGAKYRDIAPALRNATYTAYLKAQGVHDGLLSYARVVRLVEGYRLAKARNK